MYLVYAKYPKTMINAVIASVIGVSFDRMK